MFASGANHIVFLWNVVVAKLSALWMTDAGADLIWFMAGIAEAAVLVGDAGTILNGHWTGRQEWQHIVFTRSFSCAIVVYVVGVFCETRNKDHECRVTLCVCAGFCQINLGI